MKHFQCLFGWWGGGERRGRGGGGASKRIERDVAIWTCAIDLLLQICPFTHGPSPSPEFFSLQIFIQHFKCFLPNGRILMVLQSNRVTRVRGCSSVDGASGWHATYTGYTPRRVKDFFALRKYSLTVSAQHPCAIAFINICERVKNSEHRKPYHCLETRKCCTHW